MERLDPVLACSRWQTNQLPAHTLLLAVAQLEARGTEVFAPAGATFEMIWRTFVKIAVRVAPMIDAGRAAASPHFHHKTRSDCRRGGALFRAPRTPTTMAGADAEAACVGLEAHRGSRIYRRTHDHPRHHRWSLGVVPFLSLDRLQKHYSRHYIIPPMPPWLWSG